MAVRVDVAVGVWVGVGVCVCVAVGMAVGVWARVASTMARVAVCVGVGVCVGRLAQYARVTATPVPTRPNARAATAAIARRWSQRPPVRGRADSTRVLGAPHSVHSLAVRAIGAPQPGQTRLAPSFSVFSASTAEWASARGRCAALS